MGLGCVAFLGQLSSSHLFADLGAAEGARSRALQRGQTEKVKRIEQEETCQKELHPMEGAGSILVLCKSIMLPTAATCPQHLEKDTGLPLKDIFIES